MSELFKAAGFGDELQKEAENNRPSPQLPVLIAKFEEGDELLIKKQTSINSIEEVAINRFSPNRQCVELTDCNGDTEWFYCNQITVIDDLNGEQDDDE